MACEISKSVVCLMGRFYLKNTQQVLHILCLD